MRLAFAVAAHLHADVLIVDEVLAVGDAAFQRRCPGAMEDVARSGRTVLFLGHNMNAVRRLCTRGVHLDEGRVVFDGDTETAIHRYLQDQHAGAGRGARAVASREQACLEEVRLEGTTGVVAGYEHTCRVREHGAFVGDKRPDLGLDVSDLGIEARRERLGLIAPRLQGDVTELPDGEP